MEEAKETIDQYVARIEKDLSIFKFEVEPAFEEIMNASEKERYGWDAQKCFQNAYTLNKFQTYLSNLMAELNNRIDWFERNLLRMHGQYAQQYVGYFNEKCIQLDAENTHCMYLVRRIGETKAIKNLISAQYYGVKDFIKALELIGRSKNDSQRS